MPTRIIAGETYTLVKQQRSGLCIYRTPDRYLRIGPKEIIAAHLATHQHIEHAGFPVAKILSVGEDTGDSYFIESSLGERRFTDIFADEYKATGSISDASFEQFLGVSMQYLRAQIALPARPEDRAEFEDAVHLELLCRELPSHEQAIRARFDRCYEALRPYPYRFMHGDLNPSNMYPAGVIDFEDTASGPIGYDMVAAIETTDWFPMDSTFEFVGKYRYTDEQKRRFFAACDAEFSSAGLPALSAAVQQFEFFRAIWLTVRMQEWPKLQQYRYDLFIKKYLS